MLKIISLFSTISLLSGALLAQPFTLKKEKAPAQTEVLHVRSGVGDGIIPSEVPIDNGILFLFGGALLLGGYYFIKTKKTLRYQADSK